MKIPEEISNMIILLIIGFLIGLFVGCLIGLHDNMNQSANAEISEDTEISEEIHCYDVRDLMNSIQDSDSDLDEIYDTLCDYKNKTDKKDVLCLIHEAENNITYE